MSRYQHLFTEIAARKPKRLMEIGVWDGEHSKQMIECALKHQRGIEYFGFDLFEAGQTWESEEQGGKTPPRSMEWVQARLDRLDASVTLVKGDTNDTLKDMGLPIMDFVFIDGGHSVETIASDWDSVRRVMDFDTVVVFDDYYADHGDKGCRTVIDSIDRKMFNVEILDGTDEFKKSWGTLRVNFVKVSRRRG